MLIYPKNKTSKDYIPVLCLVPVSAVTRLDNRSDKSEIVTAADNVKKIQIVAPSICLCKGLGKNMGAPSLNPPFWIFAFRVIFCRHFIVLLKLLQFLTLEDRG